MGKIFYDGTTKVVAVARTDSLNEKVQQPAGSSILAFDEISNPALADGITADMALHTVVAGVFKKSGVTVTIQPDATDKVQLQGSIAGGVRVQADRSTSSNAYIDVPDLQFQLAPNSHYAFEFDGAYAAAAGTTGVQLALDGPASPNFFGAGFDIATAAGTWISAFSGAYNSGVDGTASGGATPLPFHIYGTISTGAAGGLLKLRGRSEVNGSQVTIKRGSYGKLFKMG